MVRGQGNGKRIFRTDLHDLRLDLEDGRIEFNFPNLVKRLFQVRERQFTAEILLKSFPNLGTIETYSENVPN